MSSTFSASLSLTFQMTRLSAISRHSHHKLSDINHLSQSNIIFHHLINPIPSSQSNIALFNITFNQSFSHPSPTLSITIPSIEGACVLPDWSNFFFSIDFEEVLMHDWISFRSAIAWSFPYQDPFSHNFRFSLNILVQNCLLFRPRMTFPRFIYRDLNFLVYKFR